MPPYLSRGFASREIMLSPPIWRKHQRCLRMTAVILCVVAAVSCNEGALVGHFHESGTVVEVARQLRETGAISPPAIFAYVGEERGFREALGKVRSGLSSSWQDKFLIITADADPKASVGSLLPPRFVFGVSRFGEIATLPSPVMNAETMRELTLMLDSPLTLSEQLDLTASELKRITEARFQGDCSPESSGAAQRDYALFLEVCDSCATGEALREILSRAASIGRRSCVAVPDFYETLIAELRGSPQVQILAYDKQDERMRRPLLRYRILSSGRPLVWG